jgi:hypothetical protein
MRFRLMPREKQYLANQAELVSTVCGCCEHILYSL